MAIYIQQTTTVVVNGVTLSTRAQAVTIEGTSDEVDVTAFTGLGHREYLIGLKDVTATVNFFQDFTAASTDATLWPLWASNTPFIVEFKPTNAAISTTNPAYRLTQAIMPTYSPIAGAVGEASQTSVTFRNAPGGILERDTTP